VSPASAGRALSDRLRRALTLPLFAQVLALLLIALVAAQAINLGIVFFTPPPNPEIYTTAEIAQALNARGRTVTDNNGRRLTARPAPGPTPPGRLWPIGRERDYGEAIAAKLKVSPDSIRAILLNRREPESFRRGTVGAANQRRETVDNRQATNPDSYLLGPLVVDQQLPDGGWQTLRLGETGLFSAWQKRILLWFAISVLPLAPLAYVFARRLAAPIAAFAEAAEQFGRDPTAPHLALAGPSEIGVAAVAFNEMQDRLRRYVEDRTAMVGAVAHDLRTPLTRLRFRVESAPEPVRSKMTNDIEQMDAMIAATLAFVRDASHTGERARLELSSLVQSVADEMAETGANVTSDPTESVIVEGDPIALRRLVTNLIDNAVKFAGNARARVYADGEDAVIEVDDDGPGVLERDREQVFEPFHRGEPSRSRETGGAGLGLAVVRSVARSHGGDASLMNREGGGLRATVRLPL
jgi:signal transduction histidine kinase